MLQPYPDPPLPDDDDLLFDDDAHPDGDERQRGGRS